MTWSLISPYPLGVPLFFSDPSGGRRGGGRDLNEVVLCWEWRPAEIRHRVFCFNVRNLERNFTGLLGDQASNMTAKLPLKCCFPNNVIFIAWCSFCICCFIKIPLG